MGYFPIKGKVPFYFFSLPSLLSASTAFTQNTRDPSVVVKKLVRYFSSFSVHGFSSFFFFCSLPFCFTPNTGDPLVVVHMLLLTAWLCMHDDWFMFRALCLMMATGYVTSREATMGMLSMVTMTMTHVYGHSYKHTIARLYGHAHLHV